MKMVLAAQNKYWGTIEEATQFWSTLGVNHLMIKFLGELRLVNNSGKIIKKDFEKLSRLQRKYRVKYHLHPFDLIVNGVFTDSSLTETHSILKQVLIDLDEAIDEYGLYPLITFHLPRFDYPEYDFDLNERTALENGVVFFKDLILRSKLALETMHNPYRNPGHALLGYKAKIFLN